MDAELCDFTLGSRSLSSVWQVLIFCLGDSPCSDLVLFTDGALEDCDDSDGAFDPLGILGGVFTFSVTFSLAFFASSDELIQCVSGPIQFDLICTGGVGFCIFSDSIPGQNRVVCPDVLHLTHVIWPFGWRAFC